MAKSLHWLDRSAPAFPDPASAFTDPNGLLAAGGDLSPERILLAYRQGIFPWYEDPQPILWWSPDPRAVLVPEQLHVSRSLRKCLRSGRFQVSMDRRFTQVLEGCARSRATEGTWITSDMAAAYQALHELGYAHSVEIEADGELVGGLYGLALGQVFFGESMFSLHSNASKIALYALCAELRHRGFVLIDCQVESEHLNSMGAVHMPRPQFIDLLRQHAQAPDSVGRWQLHDDIDTQLNTT